MTSVYCLRGRFAAAALVGDALRAATTRFAGAFFAVAFLTATLRAETVFFAGAFATAADLRAGAVFFTDVARNDFFAATRFFVARPSADFVDEGNTSDFGLAVRRALSSAAEFSGRHERPPMARSVSDEAGPALPDA